MPEEPTDKDKSSVDGNVSPSNRMDVFELRENVVSDYAAYTRSFISIEDDRIKAKVEQEMSDGLLWPEPLLQLNPSFTPGKKIDELVDEGVLHKDCSSIFRIKNHENDFGKELRLHSHQEEAIRLAAVDEPYVLTTGTGSGKSLSYIIPAVDHVLRAGSGNGIKAIVVYPMNALANSQREELDKFLRRGFGGASSMVTFARYTGQESEQEREKILNNPPDILLTNYVMLELILTRVDERRLVEHTRNLRFLVFDELHTYRGRQGSDVSMLIRRCREIFQSNSMHCVGTSATMTSDGDSTEQARIVGEVASKIFGETIPKTNVIGETLQRSTAEFDYTSPDTIADLKNRIDTNPDPETDFDGLRNSTLASWIESTFGLGREESTGKLIRRSPRPLKGGGGAVEELSSLTNSDPKNCEKAIRKYLYAGSNCSNPETDYPPLFAFRLHQFITRGDTVWTSLEGEQDRTITLRGQKYVPGDRDKILLPVVFCRHCGQEYYRVDRPASGLTGPYLPRNSPARTISEELESGYLYISHEHPWPNKDDEIIERLPDDWIEEKNGNRRVKRGRNLPEPVRLATNGEKHPEGVDGVFIEAPFRFCLNPKCGVAYGARQRSDALKLSGIGVDGRSTATTILALSTILKLRGDESLKKDARKLLSFTDNRQDASLQAGHFNDFVEVGLIRSGLYRAMNRFGDSGIAYDDLVHHVENALNLPVDLYANDPELRGPALSETRRALRSVIGYYLYRDQQSGWRLTSPNLEQCGLLKIKYLGLDVGDELIHLDQATWSDASTHPALGATQPEKRKEIIRTLLDHLRRNLSIKEDSLDANYQEKIVEQSRQRLREPWTIDDKDDMVKSSIAWPRSSSGNDASSDLYISPRSGFGQYLKRSLPDIGVPLKMEDLLEVIQSLFGCLRKWGLIEEVRSAKKGTSVQGYQVPASVIYWSAGGGSEPMQDPLRITRKTEAETKGNEYFLELYKRFAEIGSGLEGREHTAQVPSELREERENEFRNAELPLLFCSPTMELGVDIAQLNVVNMRNVPPTPANYAQRSGRAGRSGQPAFVYTYCSGFSPHDQYYFKSPERMVAGSVTSPKLDLLNRDLVKSHVHAIWLSEAQMSLGTTLSERVLVVSEQDLSLPLRDEVNEKLADARIKSNARQRARDFLKSVGRELETVSWYSDDWLDAVLQGLPQSFDQACDRWRTLYKAAVQQRQTQNDVIGDHARPPADRDRAKRLRAQAESQINLLVNPQNASEGDFYSYRYFASEGFLPGYNFPRLPISAFIPARRGRKGRDEYLSRPRFLAISEYGPRAVIYHEGSRYRINKVNLALDDSTQQLTRVTLKECSSCGFGHDLSGGPIDNCENCGAVLEPASEIRELVRLQNVTAKRADRITSNEEERQRVGYEIKSLFRFAKVNNTIDCRNAEVQNGDVPIAKMRYGDAATIWRINMGWRQRKNRTENGFLLDLERGYWATNKEAGDSDKEDPMSAGRIERVVPFVEDRRNVLTLALQDQQGLEFMASLQAALKQGIQQIYQLEPYELAAEPLPSAEDRRSILFYEASEGGAGVLRQIAEEPTALAEVAKVALENCHFDPDTLDDLGSDVCAAACYDCLLEYGNQTDHKNIDRHLLKEFLANLAKSTTAISGSQKPRVDHFSDLYQQCDSKLEKKWLDEVNEYQLKPPSDAQYLIKSCSTRPDFFYKEDNVAIYIDGPVHDRPEEEKYDESIGERLADAGYLAIRFHHAADWKEVFDKHPDIFGKRKGAD